MPSPATPKITVAPNRRRIQRQGSLDGLCGLYVIINCLSLQRGREFDTAQAFGDMVDLLGGDQFAHYAVIGMKGSQLMRLARSYSALTTERHGFGFKLQRVTTPSGLGAYWRGLMAHQAKNGEGSVIIGMAGCHDHWTCLRRITADSLVTADSGSMTTIPRHETTLGRATSARPYQLCWNDTFLVTMIPGR